MPRIRLLHWLLAMLTVIVLMVSGSFIPAVGQSRESQDIRSVPLLQSGVTINQSSRSGGLKEYQVNGNGVSIGSQFYQVQFFLWANSGYFSQITFSVDPSEYSLFKLKAGVRDEWSGQSHIDLKIFQGGSVVKNYTNINPGEIIRDVNLNLNDQSIDNSNNIGIRIDCHTGQVTCYLEFIQANLVPAGNYVQPSEVQSDRRSSSQPTVLQTRDTPPQRRQNSFDANDAMRILDTIRGIFR